MPNVRFSYPRCNECYKKNVHQYLIGRGERVWNNVELVSIIDSTGWGGDTAVLRCRNCGHQYKSQSKAAQRMIRAARMKERNSQSC